VLGSGDDKTEMAGDFVRVGLRWWQALDKCDLGMGLGLRAQIWGIAFFIKIFVWRWTEGR
jgi:hypothetical protein